MDGRPEEDLRRAIAQLTDEDWVAAADLAQRLVATTAFADGLSAVEEGVALASRLGLETDPSVRRRLLREGAPWGSIVLAEIAGLSWRERARLLRRLLAPSPRVLRKSTPLARRGRAGLAAAYALRPLRLALRLPPAARAWKAAGRGGHEQDARHEPQRSD
jgi:hypothetical protein